MNANHDKKEYWAAHIQRVSGVLLALFLPIHFLVLSLSLQGHEWLDIALSWTENPLVKLAEAGLVVLLSVHLIGGVRLLLIEFLEWGEWQSRAIAVGGMASVAIGCLFLLRAI